jgi:AraC-like DNA-binding protein
MTFVVSGFILKVGFDVWFKLAEHDSTGSVVAIYASRLILFLFINIMVFKGLKKPFLLLGETSIINEKKQPLSKSLQDKYLEKLLSYTCEFKPYLNPEITLEELAGLVDIPPRSLSWILNERLNQSFYEFINRYRVKESERIFRELDSDHKTILEVLFEVGFNSKSSFNTAFKKYNEMTPTEYRKLKSVQLN